MHNTVRDNAHVVLLPAFAHTRLSERVKRFLSNGGCSILLGETREEYVSRKMSAQRRQDERADTILDIAEEAKTLSGNVIVAVDQEIAGICRLHDLVPPFPLQETIEGLSKQEFEAICSTIAAKAKELGVNCFLGPILDIVTGENPWLSARTWSTNPYVIAEKSSAFIRAIQANGVAATAKHFPGYSAIEKDPAVDPNAKNIQSLQSFKNSFVPFIDAIKNGVEMVMTGPAIVEAFDATKAASLSPIVIEVLREELGFKGVILSDDLDAEAILRGHPITHTAIEALNAGCDYLLIADSGEQIDQIISAIVAAVEAGDLEQHRLAEAAAKVRSLAMKYSESTSRSYPALPDDRPKKRR